MDLKEAYASMKADKEVVRNFLLARGIPEEDFAFLAIDMEQKFKSVPQFNDDGDLVHREQVFDGYKLTRGFKVTSDDIDLIERISQMRSPSSSKRTSTSPPTRPSTSTPSSAN